MGGKIDFRLDFYQDDFFRMIMYDKMMRVKVAGIELARFRIDCAVDFMTTEECMKIYC